MESLFACIIVMTKSIVHRISMPSIRVTKYSGHEAVISIMDGSLLSGELPANKLRLVDAWIEIHRDELLANWSLAVSGEEVFRIEPLH